MSKVKESPPTDNEAEEEFSVEKVLDRRVVKGKVHKILSPTVILSNYWLLRFIILNKCFSLNNR